jgi:hypothetical protein
MPTGPAVSAVGPWISDANRPTCIECYTEFGLLTRRHHCRRCGEIFCAKCSKYTSREIPELPHYQSKPLRVCKCCFLRHLSYMVVAHSTFGLKVEIFGSRADATRYYNKFSRSRLMLRMHDNAVIATFFENDRVRSRITQKAQGARNFLLGGHQFAGQLRGTSDTSRLTYAGDVRITPGASTIVFVRLWGNTLWHYTFREIRDPQERQRQVSDFMEMAHRTKEVSKAVVLTLRGLTALNAYSDGAFSRTAQAVIAAQNYVKALPCMLVLHIAGQCSTMTLPNIAVGLDRLDQAPMESSAILLSPRMEVMARHRCDVPSFLEELRLRGGAELPRALLNVDRLAVVSPRDVVGVVSNFAAAQQAAEQEYITHRHGAESFPIAIFALSDEARYRNQEPTATVAPADDASVEEAFRGLFEVWVHGTPAEACRPVRDSLAVHRRVQAARELVSAVRHREEAARNARLEGSPRGDDAEPGSPSGRRPASGRRGGDGQNAANSYQSSRGVSPSAQADLLMCNICMENFNTTSRKPVVCPSCGNTVCLACWMHIRECPMSRCPKPERPIANILLLSMLESPSAFAGTSR